MENENENNAVGENHENTYDDYGLGEPLYDDDIDGGGEKSTERIPKDQATYLTI
ncbi:6692_t:CDS:2 [Funneliformis caledonium]|uniref:6692_t:CDS:1 n=1 Tax=Funneliformis caledonium TaxID=1117310 RepID=A0A9N9I4P9_9GLOM|nr:6692_t:CDS:2 [Funneliformis caledonium]